MRRLRDFLRDRRGSTIVEFAFVAPVMCLLLMGLCDLAYQVYAQAILNGAVQKAGRDSAIQGGNNNTTAIDAKVSAVVKQIAKTATFTFTRTNYDTFSLAKPETFTDTNNNGIRDPGECFTDVNGNNQWDAAPGDDGQGGANDVSSYTVTVTYPRLFAVAGLFGWSSTNTISASTLLKNQPYATQSVLTVTAKQVCT
ncbi:TadE family protein [Sphingomonas immobilis]|uniref:TadE/TadG family type IV pilus assembly protein n=1 Tax=Sphingomonas immobilis TaxID=3063997 RepID=A0ABT8ZZL2_9SPHN|nr:TadE/TadG family type IV pilus assembly protein [Sphingomonas sp. CA1-15]MDO7843014.1 TadE/TadG family type IV pilus assembly protein [Sphingomonas sp. CA1-15]